MNTCPGYIVDYMHAYLDGEISKDEQSELDVHLASCTLCNELMSELTAATELLESADPIQAPERFVGNVMARLPKEKSKAGVHRWLRKHPILVAAAMFLILMSASLFSNYGDDQQFSVTMQPELVVDSGTVLVPEGVTVKGDVLVKNGELRVEGAVDGNITVINGTKYMASTAIVTGKSEEINKVFDWLWYKMKTTIKDILPQSQQEDSVEE